MKYVKLSAVKVPQVFIDLARNYYHLEPEDLAALMLLDFCKYPPHNLVIIERGPANG